jgi:hypothetical protein
MRSAVKKYNTNYKKKIDVEGVVRKISRERAAPGSTS